MKKIWSILLSITLLISSFAMVDFSAFSANTINESESNNYIGSANKYEIEYTLKGKSKTDDVDFFKFTLDKGGKVTFNCKIFGDTKNYKDGRFHLYNSTMGEVSDGSNHYVFFDNKYGYNYAQWQFMLQPGTYYFSIVYYGSQYANYEITTSLSASNQSFKEPDNYSTKAHTINLGQKYYGQIDSYFDDFDNGHYDRDYDYYKFYLPVSGTVNVSFTLNRDYSGYSIFNFELFDSTCEKRIFTESSSGCTVDSNTRTVSLSKGTYYIAITGQPPHMITYSLNVNYKPATPKTLTVSARGVNSIKLSWSTVSSATGYQLQRLSGGTYKTVATTTSTSYLVKNLNPATKYTFRVRAYTTINGKNFYSSFKSLATPTKPANVTLTSLKTNTNHQVISYWRAVSAGSGYQVQYATDKGFKKIASTKIVSGRTTAKHIGGKFTKGKTYYVRVRAYVNVNGTKYYGNWSNIKAIKCK